MPSGIRAIEQLFRAERVEIQATLWYYVATKGDTGGASVQKDFYYVVVEIGGKKYFINKDMDYTEDYDTVLRFESEALAQDFIEKRDLSLKQAKVFKAF